LKLGGLLLLAACGSSDEPAAVVGVEHASDVVTGSLLVDGQPAALGACRPGHAIHVFVELATSRGKLRFEDTKLYWNPAVDSPDRGAELACRDLQRSWGGGNRADGTSYWRGTLMFDCGSVKGNVTLDCGGITAAERAQLDQNRSDSLNKR
jgi:hypothetical protein